jgi:hypothetical protein
MKKIIKKKFDKRREAFTKNAKMKSLAQNFSRVEMCETAKRTRGHSNDYFWGQFVLRNNMKDEKKIPRARLVR